MKAKYIFIFSLFSFFMIGVNACRTARNDKYPMQNDTPINLLKRIETNNAEITITEFRDITIYAGHESLRYVYLKILESKSWNEEYKQKVRTEYAQFNILCDSAVKNNKKLSLIDESNILPVLKSKLGEVIDDLLYKGECRITSNSKPIEQIICRRIDYSEYSCEFQYLYDDKVIWGYSMEI